MLWKYKAMIAAIVVGGIVLLHFLQTVVWDGTFPMTVTLQATPQVDIAHLKFEACGNQKYADFAMEVGFTEEGLFGDGPFQSTQMLDANTYLVSVPCSGRSGPFEIEYSYIESQFLVVEFKTTDSGNAPPLRKQFSIPAGRGQRSMTITLP